MTERIETRDSELEPGELGDVLASVPRPPTLVEPGRAEVRQPRWPRLLSRDPAALLAAAILFVAVLAAVFGPIFFTELAQEQNLYVGPLKPFTLDAGWAYVLGGDTLGRSVLARLIVGSRTTLVIAACAVGVAFLVGSSLGMWAGYRRGWRETIAMRASDVILSFPSLLLAIVVLYVFSSSIANVVFVLAFARIPIYLRTARIETAELRGRLFVDASRTFGTRNWMILRRHIAPTILPTLLTVAALDFSLVMLAESTLDFLGIGIQPPGISWGLMVSEGRNDLQDAWWLATFPGVAIVITTVSATVLAGWMRLAMDPDQRWRLTLTRRQRKGLRSRQSRLKRSGQKGSKV